MLRARPDSALLQLSRIAEGERGDAARVLVEDQGAGDRRFGALAAVFALAKPAIDPDRRAFGFLEVHACGVDQTRRMANFTAEPNGEARLRLRMQRYRPPPHLCDREIPGAVRQFDDLLEQPIRRVEGGVHVPERAG